MGQGNGIKVADERRLLVERVASSRYVNRSARLRDMLLYLADRVLDEDAGEIHEQEVGHRVFGRPADYDTASDNIVRVHASMLRKRLEQYFAAEGAAEPLRLEIPKGNYAPVFHGRQGAEAPREAPPRGLERSDWRVRALASLALLFAGSTAFLLVRAPGSRTAQARDARGATVRQFWSQIFQPDRTTDIVLDDAAVGLYQELSGKSFSLSDYFGRSYLRGLSGEGDNMVLRRQSSAATIGFLWKLPAEENRPRNLRFARDYTFRELKADNAVLLGNARSNPWIQAFESRIAVHWQFDQSAGVYYPADSATGKSYRTASAGAAHEGYFSVALLPNLGATGSVLIVGGTGGSAVNAGADFLEDESAMAELRRRLPGNDRAFPFFETLVRVKGRSAAPEEDAIVIARVP